MPQARIVIKDEVNAIVKGLDPGTLDLCQERLSYFVPGHFHMPSFRLGRWDGRIRLFQKSGATQTNLLPYIEDIFDDNGYSIKVEEHTEDYSHITSKINLIDKDYLKGYYNRTTGIEIELWEHQVEAVNRCLLEGSGVLELATGSGKTFICGILSKIYQQFGHVVVIVPSLDLIVKTQRDFAAIGIDAGMWYADIKERKQVTIATWQSLDHAPELFHDVVCLIVDEVHEAKAPVLSEILLGPGSNVPFRFGCSGTLPKEELFRRQIEGMIAPTIFELAAWELQEKGILANSIVYQMTLADSKNPAYTRMAVTHEEWSDELNWFFSNKERARFIADLIIDIAEEMGNTFILVQYKKHGKILQSLIPDSISLDGEDKNRNDQYEWYNTQNNCVMICTFGIAKKAIDIPRIFNLVFIEPGKKFETVIQTLGRGLRKASDKDSVNVFDICGDGGFSRKHAKGRQKLYREAKQPFEILPMEYHNVNHNG